MKNESRNLLSSMLERTTGIEPASSAWEADILPMNYVRKTNTIIYLFAEKVHGFLKDFTYFRLIYFIGST